MSSRFHQTYGIHTAKPRTSTRGTGLFAYAVLSYRGRRYMRPATAIKNNATMMAKGRAKITPAQLRIRPARAGTPCCFATRPCQIPRTFSNGATTTICRPPLSKSWTNNQHPRKKNRRPRAPKSRDTFAAFLPSCALCSSEGCLLACCVQSSVLSASDCGLPFPW